MMRTIRTLLCALLLVAAGASAAVATPGQADREVPIKGYVVGVDEVPDESSPGCATDGVPLLWRFTSAGSGVVSHLGPVTYTFTHCTHIDLSITEGELELTADNGDVLLLTYSAQVIGYTPGDPTAVWEMSWAADGGTGRFASATGSGDGHATTYVPPSDPITALNFHGGIAYDASDRAGK